MQGSHPDTRTALLEAALVCFSQNSYEGASMRMIAQTMERPVSLLAHHFGNKEALYLEVFRYLLGAIIPLREEPAPPLPRTREEAIQGIRDGVREVYRAAVFGLEQNELIREHGARLFVQEMMAPRPFLRPLLARHLVPTAHSVRACIQVLHPEYAEAEATFLGAALLSSVVGHTLMSGFARVVWGESGLGASPQRDLDLLLGLGLNGILDGVGPGH